MPSPDAGAREEPTDIREAGRLFPATEKLAYLNTAADPAHVLAELKQRGVVCAARDGNLRVAIHLYNHEDDIQQLTQALAELRASRAPSIGRSRRGPQSSLVMAPNPRPRKPPTNPLAASWNETTRYSFASTSVSPFTRIVTVSNVSPGTNVTVPETTT